MTDITASGSVQSGATCFVFLRFLGCGPYSSSGELDLRLLSRLVGLAGDNQPSHNDNFVENIIENISGRIP